MVSNIFNINRVVERVSDLNRINLGFSASSWQMIHISDQMDRLEAYLHHAIQNVML